MVGGKPFLNLIFPFVDPITGENRFGRMDKYPLFDEQVRRTLGFY